MQQWAHARISLKTGSCRSQCTWRLPWPDGEQLKDSLAAEWFAQAKMPASPDSSGQLLVSVHNFVIEVASCSCSSALPAHTRYWLQQLRASTADCC